MSVELTKTPNALIELYKNKETALLMPRDVSSKFLNVDPPEAWVKTHPFIKGYKYLPIEKVEFLLAVIFQVYKIEVIEYKMILNAVTVHVRVHYKDLTTGEMMFHDGVGALEPQTKGGTGALRLDIENINPGAIAMALPIAKSVAVKDACDHLGRVFGSSLNRKDSFSETDFNAVKESVEDARLKIVIASATSVEYLKEQEKHVPRATVDGEEHPIRTLFNEKLNSFK